MSALVARDGWGWGGYCWREVSAPTSKDRDGIKARFNALVQRREADPQVKGKAA